MARDSAGAPLSTTITSKAGASTSSVSASRHSRNSSTIDQQITTMDAATAVGEEAGSLVICAVSGGTPAHRECGERSSSGVTHTLALAPGAAHAAHGPRSAPSPARRGSDRRGGGQDCRRELGDTEDSDGATIPVNGDHRSLIDAVQLADRVAGECGAHVVLPVCQPGRRQGEGHGEITLRGALAALQEFGVGPEQRLTERSL